MGPTERKAVESLIPVAENMAMGDGELQAQMLYAACLTVEETGNTDRGFLIKTMELERYRYWYGRGSSVDNGDKRHRGDITIERIHDAFEDIFAWREQFIDFEIPCRYDYSKPADTALFNIGLERFRDSLTPEEEYRVSHNKVLNAPRNSAVRSSVRRKFRDQFGI